MSSVACCHRTNTTHTDGPCRASHAIISLRNHTRSDYVGRGMPSSLIDNTHDRTTSGVARHHLPWATHTVRRCWAWHLIITLGKHILSHEVGCGMLSSPLDNTHDRTIMVAFLHGLGQHTRLDYVRRVIPSSPLGNTHDWTTSGMAWPHR